MRADADKYLTKQEVKRLFGVIKSKRDRAIFRVVYFQGLRASEVGELQLSSFRRKEGRLIIRRLKGSLVSSPVLSPDEIRHLNAWIAERGAEPGPLFPSNRGAGISRQRLHMLMRQYCEAAGIGTAKAHMHALKHSLGTHLMQAGFDLYTIKRILGHKRITSTEVYTHMADSEVDAAARRFSEEW